VIARFLATGFYSGYAPVAPGTFGTLAAVPLAYVLYVATGASGPLYVLALGICVGAATWACDRFAAELGVKDPSVVVADEIAGYLLAVAFMPATVPRLFAAFVAFRFFDIVKPPPVRQAERLPGGLGIVADDLLAGVLANLVVRLAAHFLGI
jgi:phosphatidylglycerophosphatase A